MLAQKTWEKTGEEEEFFWCGNAHCRFGQIVIPNPQAGGKSLAFNND
jgi:hypothetical protein